MNLAINKYQSVAKRSTEMEMSRWYSCLLTIPTSGAAATRTEESSQMRRSRAFEHERMLCPNDGAAVIVA